MGISPHVAEIIIREHAFRPFKGKVVLLGHQTMLFSPQEAIDLVISCGLTPSISQADTLAVDKSTLLSDEGQRGYIRDTDFFSLLGVREVIALDHSDYEGAEIIWNLNLPIPKEMEEIADVIIDGSTIDNVFDPACTLRNISRLLKPHGRLISTALGSNHYAPYMVPSPQWFHDYFVYNNYLDVKEYYLVYSKSGLNVFTIDFETQSRATAATETLHSPYVVGIVSIAEKGPSSTSDINPSQHHYRPDDEWAIFDENMHRIRSSRRPPHIRSRSARDDAIPSIFGFRFIEAQDVPGREGGEASNQAFHSDVMQDDFDSIIEEGDLDLAKMAFNEKYYISQIPNANVYEGGAIEHYLKLGWKKGADPNSGFSGIGYLKANPDVAKSGMNPLIHYLRYGMVEGRVGHQKIP